MKQRYFKISYDDGTESLFSSNNQMANLLYGKLIAEKGGTIREISKNDYKKEEMKIDLKCFKG